MKNSMLNEHIIALSNSVAFADNGKPYWITDRSSWLHAGDTAGRLNTDGYRIIGLLVEGVYKSYSAHRIHWFKQYGVWPLCQIDHLDRDRDNNAIVNLRLATVSENKQNSEVRADSKTGVKGVSKKSRGNYEAHIGLKGIRYTKRFKTLEEAVAWRKEQEKLLHPFRVQ